MFTILEEGDFVMKNILIIGATSAIATAWARNWADKNASFFLVGRSEEKLNAVAADLNARGAGKTQTYALDLNRIEQHEAMLNKCLSGMNTIDIAMIAYGTLPNQKSSEENADYAVKEFTNNATSTIALLTQLANSMEKQKSGTIAVISSVAGDRGRPSNYLYGSAKAAVTTFCSGLRARLSKNNVHLVTIKPGFIDTPMTQGMKFPGILISSPEKAAACIDKAITANKNEVYVPRFWEGIMLVIKYIPEKVFKKMTL